MKPDAPETSSTNGDYPNGNPQTKPRARCIALCPRTDSGSVPPLPAELQSLLAERSSIIECHAEPLEVMASLVIHERAFASGTHREPMLLILVEPSKLFGVESLVRAMSKYAHHAAVWQYDPASARRLSPYAAPVAPPPTNGNGRTVGNGNGNARAPEGQPRARTVASTAPSFVSWVGMPRAAPPEALPTPKLRLAGTPSSETAAATAGQGPARPTAVKPALTDEEMAMLLGNDTPGENNIRSTRGTT